MNSIQKTAPPGYQSSRQFLYEFVCFGPALWEGATFMVLLFHIERSIRFSKEGNAHSRGEAMDGIYNEREDTGEIEWIRGPAGVANGTWTETNKALLIDREHPQVVEFVDVMHKKGPRKGCYSHTKPKEPPRVLNSIATLKTKRGKRGGSGKTYYEVDTLRVKAVIEEWKTATAAAIKKAQSPSLLDGSGGTDSDRSAVTIPVEKGKIVTAQRSGGDRPAVRTVTAQRSLSSEKNHTDTHRARALGFSDLQVDSFIVSGCDDGATPDTTHSLFPEQENQRRCNPAQASGQPLATGELEAASKTLLEMGAVLDNQNDLGQIVKAMEAAMGRPIKNHHPAPGRFLAILRKFDWPVDLGCWWIQDLAVKKRKAHYEISGPGLFVTAAGEEGIGLVPWFKANPTLVERAFRERDLRRHRRECEEEIRKGTPVVEIQLAIEPARPGTCPTCGQEAVIDGICTGKECGEQRDQERAAERRTANGGT